MDRPTDNGNIVVADGLPLQRLYERFDAIAKGRAFGNSSAAHLAVIVRLASNQRRAEELGWRDFVLERAGSTGRLELRGVPASAGDHQLVPDAIPYDGPELVTSNVRPGSGSRRSGRALWEPAGNSIMAVPHALARRRRALGMSTHQTPGMRDLLDLAPDYWRFLVRHAPRTAVDRLIRDIRSEEFAVDGLRARARELRAHLCPAIRDRAQLEVMPLLNLEYDGLGSSTWFD